MVNRTKEALPLRDLQSCYLVVGEQQFMSVVMSHCHYSLTRGKGTEVYYDIAALERHFLSHFVHGRPLFDLSTAPIVVQCRNIHTSENFAAIRKNIRPQVGSLLSYVINTNKYLVLLETYYIGYKEGYYKGAA